MMAFKALGLLVLLPFVLLVAVCEAEMTCSGIVPMRERRETINIVDFGGVGDGRKINTWAFRKAIYRIQHMRKRGGTMLYVPPGVWLTGSFNLTSHMTLYLARGAIIKATKNAWDWPLVDPLPSYGRGRELPGGRYASFILGDKISDVIITGNKGVIDGQGGVWWNMWRRRLLRFTRPHLLEFMHSRDILISNLVFKNSPFWNIHPVYCSNVVIRHISIVAPRNSPNTDGIDPDSSSNVCIEDSFISTGDDLVAIKSGWDEYGIYYGRPSSDITVRRITGSTPFSGIAIGSEASGGIQNIYIENIKIYNTGIGIHIKTTAGRGGYIKNVRVSDITMINVRKGVRIVGNAGDHPDKRFNVHALPVVDGVTIRNVWGVGIQQPGLIQGIRGARFTRICMQNVKLWGFKRKRNLPWKCEDVSGVAMGVEPWPCVELGGSVERGYCYGDY